MRYVCVHGHFYQPPRENPWTGVVPRQPSAAPYHDWNERIADECYRPNLPNYPRVSFNFGPTLLQWFGAQQRELLDAVVDADRRGRPAFGGHGPAMAQAWGHAILPLCTARDRRTQVHWGMTDFAFRFGRQAEGLWLPETAVDTETLETLSLLGVSFTVLSPYQAEAVRPAGGSWTDVSNGTIDTRRAYRAELPSGRDIALFFYDGPLSSALAFEGLARDGRTLADRLRHPLDDDGVAQLSHVATDGETYGHHHAGGAAALDDALRRLEDDPTVRLTCYGEFLERHPPVDEVRILERSSWSCPHELGRWQRHCGCSADATHEQHWRAPLRRGIDELREQTAQPWEERVSRVLHDPWAARDAWIEILLDPSTERFRTFLERHARAGRQVARDELEPLFELQLRLIQAETSCAWFFEDLARIETIQVLQYAARAIELARKLLGLELAAPFLDVLEEAHSNDLRIGNGRDLWTKKIDVRP